jgi:hypothetical protein
MVFVTIARFDNELKTNANAKAMLTGPDTLSNYETTAETATRRGIALTGTYSGTDLATEVFIDPSLAEGDTVGLLEHTANLTTREAIISSAEVFDIGTITTVTDGTGITTTDFNGPEISLARGRVGRLRAQFTDDDIRLFEVAVSITQTDPTAIGLV